jgi:hypothetical protein
MRMLPNRVRRALARWIVGLVRDVPMPAVVPACTSARGHEFTPWTVVEHHTPPDAFGMGLFIVGPLQAIQRRRCPNCGLTQQTRLLDPSTAKVLS